MKNQRFYVLLALVLMAFVRALGGEVAMPRAKALGAKFVEANFKNVTPLEWAYTGISEGGRPAFHVFNGASGGFVIVSACDLTSPLLGYSETGTFDGNLVHPNLKYFLDGYAQSVDYAEENLKKATWSIAQEWENLERLGRIQSTKSGVVEPLIATRWDQGCYYNASCPKDDAGPCEKAYVGCVAASMGQVMKYWSYPEQGTGEHSYTCQPYGELHANFGQTHYNWDAMPESLNEPHHDLALILFHCGVSVNMMYSAYASGAYERDIPAALSTYFGYAPSQCLLREDYSLDEWVSIMREALDSDVPILYAGQDGESSGHAFVCDGYDANGLFHFNWCWGGVYDGYYNVDNLQVGSNSWNAYQQMVPNARPLPVYNETPKAPTNFTVEPTSDESYTADLHWTNPSKTLNNSNLTHIDQIIVKCDGEEVYSASIATPGGTMQISVEVPHYGLHDFQVYAVSNDIHGLIASSDGVRFGPNCTWTIVATSSASTGWQGGAIQVYNNVNQLFASAMATASQQTFSLDVPLGQVALAWVRGNSAVSTVGFSVRDAAGQEVFAYNGLGSELEEGVFLRMNNSCGNEFDCGMPQELYATTDGDKVVLTWTGGAEETDYNIYRDGQILQTLRDHSTVFVDETASHGGNCYYVTAFCASGESDPTNEACASLGDDCQPARSLWFEITSNNKVKLFWVAPQNTDELSGYYVYRTKESEMNWQKIKTVSASATSVADNSNLQDETTYLYKVVAYYQTTDCYAAPAQSRYNEFEYFVRVHWSVDGLAEAGEKGIEIYPNPAKNLIRIDGIEPAEVQVYNALGQLVKTVRNANEINVSDLADGIYLLRINATDGKCYANRVAVRR